MTTLNVYWYGYGLRAVAGGDIDWSNDTIRCAILTDAYTPVQLGSGGHQHFDDVSAAETSGSGYTAGGQEVTGKVVNLTETRVIFRSSNDVVWDPSSFSGQYAVIYKDTGDDATSPLLGYGYVPAEETSSNDEFRIQWGASDAVLELVPGVDA